MAITKVSENCNGVCNSCEVKQSCEDLRKDNESETITLTVAEYQKLLEEKEYWHREAIKQTAELGEFKMKLGKLIETSLG
jgi:hypothetical protein